MQLLCGSCDDDEAISSDLLCKFNIVPTYPHKLILLCSVEIYRSRTSAENETKS